MADINTSILDLEKRAELLRELLKYAPRPFVIEFAGTPKSGKSTSVEAVRHFFERQGFRVHVLAERAAVCPIPMKGHLFFNTWCAASMLAELLANIETDTDIMIVDRGLFDALVWLTQQERRGELTAAEARTIENFLLLGRWSTLTDLVVVMSVSAKEALERETGQRISSKPGSIMNEETLAAITEAVEGAVNGYHQHFRTVLKHNTTGEDTQISSVRLAGQLLDSMQDFLNPKVLVVPRAEIARLVSAVGNRLTVDAFERALACITAYGTFVSRDEAERSNEVVQVVAAGVLVKDDKAFLFRRKESDPKYLLYGKTTIWQGCHIESEKNGSVGDLLRRSLQHRLSRSLFLSRTFSTEPLGFCWEDDNEKSSRHFGMMFTMLIDNPYTAADLRKKAFRRKRGPSLVGEFVTWEELAKQAEDLNLEAWSRAILDSKRG